MLSEPVRRAAMERARDQDVAALSGKVVLVQEIDINVQAGTLMYVPVYRAGMPHNTIAQRRNALVGWVYSPYRMNDLMQGILGNWETTSGKQIHLEIFDSEVVSSDTLLYDSQPGETHLSHGPRSQRLVEQSAQAMLHVDNEVLADQRSAPQSFGSAQVSQQNSVISAGRQWTLRFTPTGSRSFVTDYSKVWLVLFGGTSVSLLLSGLFFYMLNTRFKALEMSRELTDELLESKQSYHNQFANNPVAMLLVDPINGAIIDANATAIGFYGYPQERLLAMRIHQITAQPEHEIILAMATVTRDQSKRFERQHILADGSIRDVEVSSSRIKFGVHMVLHLLIHDVTERNRAVQTLNETRELLSLFICHSPIYAFIKDVTPTDSRVLLASDNFHQMLGLQCENIQGKTMTELFPPEFAAKIAADDRTVITNGNIIRLEEELNGRNYYTIKYPIVRRDKTLLAGYAIDITERKQAEDALRESEAMQRTLMDNLPTGVAIIDPILRIIERANNHVATLFGGALDKIEGQRCRSLFVCPDSRANNCSSSCDLHDSEQEMLLADGSRLPIFQKTKRIQWYGRERLLTCFVDFSERKRIDELLRQTNERLSLATRSGGVGIWDYDVAKKQLNWNDQMFRLYGISSDQFGGDYQAWLTGVHPADRQRCDEELQIALRGEQEFDTDFRVLWPDGTICYIQALASVQRDGLGQPSRMIGTSWDITDIKRAEAEKEKLMIQNRQLHKSESLGRMAGAIAHHFNNQLLAVTMSLQMAKDDVANNAEALDNLAAAMDAVRKASEVSTLMLTYLGQTVAKRELLELSGVCRHILPILRASIRQSAVWEINLASPSPAISASADQLQQVLTHLVTNAAESLKDCSGVIRLTVKTVFSADISSVNRFPVDWRPKDSAYACVEVEDTGCGIPEKVIENIFDPFFSSKFVGRGLSLAVVLGILRGHHGGITVQSTPGMGSTFRVFLPLLLEAIPQKPAHVPQAPKTAEAGTVLVVDDEPVVREAVSRTLKRFGYTVFTANDGVEAVDVFLLHRDEIHCVISDLTMPRMNGWETLTALRKLKADIPVILVSGYSETDVMSGHHPELPQAFLNKPFEIEALRNAIIRVMIKKLG